LAVAINDNDNETSKPPTTSLRPGRLGKMRTRLPGWKHPGGLLGL